MNPLLDFQGLPRFSEVKPRHISPAVDRLLKENRRCVTRLVNDKAHPTWSNFVEPLEDAGERLARAWSVAAHLNAVVNSPSLRKAYNANLPKVTALRAEMAQNEGLYEKFKQLRASSGYPALSPAKRKIIENELRDFRLGGADLSPVKKKKLKALQEKLAQLSSKFQDNLLDATDAFVLYVPACDLEGVPEDVQEAARQAALKDRKEGFKLTLHAPCWLPVMQYAQNRNLREKMYHAYATRASEFGPAKWNNSPLIRRILKLRAQASRLLGFANYAQYSLATKMAQSPQRVLGFLRDLGQRSRPYARRDMQELKSFARKELGLARLRAWDIAYASEKLRLARYAFSDQEVRQYFPEPKVLLGMFKVVETLYGLSIASAQAPVWHPDVKFFDVRNLRGDLVGQFYLDLYARPNKRGGAWMDDAITRRRRMEGIQTPLAYLTCNFSPPVGDKPALFTHDEVMTLFHEFGHGLHHLLSRVDDLWVSGIHGVEWDAVELPSQFMENFCWEWDVLKHMSAHVDTDEPLPRALFEKMLAAKNFQSGMQMVRQLEFALFDMHLHYDFPVTQDPLALLARIRAQIAVVIPPAYNRFPNNFAHIFSGGYAAGYYSYKWAEVLSADAYSFFEENGVLNPEVGKRFWDEILAVGGSRPALQSFIAFRGREPKVEALLRHSGMQA